jgi:ATP-dependent RNA helicase RhlB
MHASWEESQFQVPKVDGKTRFHDFDLPSPLMHAIYDLGFEYCTPIQAEILPSTLEGRDATGRAQTGTGKTAAFLITIITRLLASPLDEKRKQASPRVLILAPTRELVMQISKEARDLSKYTDLNIVSVFGGMDYVKQRKQLARGAVDIVVATPGRLLDFKRRGDLTLKKVEILIIDEADRMLDMGFIPDVRSIIYSTPHKDKRQTMLFSATLDEDIIRLATQWTRKPVTIEIEPEQVAVESVEQIVYIVTTDEKFSLLFNIIDKQKLERVLVFCNRRDEVRRLAEKLSLHGIRCSTLSGDVPQKKRVRRLEQFKARKIRVLVATDVAGRGIHIEGMDHVINYTLPRDPEDYVHRIGRTGRAGETGTSISFADEEDAFYIPPIEKFMDQELGCIRPDDSWLIKPKPVKTKKPKRRPPRRKPRPRKPRR